MTVPDLDLPTLVALAGNGVVREVLRRMADDGYLHVKPSHGYVLQQLADAEPTVSELAAALGMTPQGASKQVKDLEELGFVERVTGPADQRIRLVRLTAVGRAMLESGRRARKAIADEVESRVGAGSLATATSVVAALIEVVGIEERVRTRTVPAPDA